MLIEITYNVTDVFVSTTQTPIYVSVSFEQPSSGGGTWGSITGTLSNQTDLQTALDAKFDDPTGTTSQYLRGDGSLATFPAIPSGTVSSVGLTMPSAFSVANSPITSSGTLAVTGAGDTTQYIAGDGSLVAFPITGQAGTLVREVRNVTGATITKGTVVYINGASGNKPTVAKALATSDATSAQTFGLIQADIPNNSNGYLVAFGDLDGLNTSAFAEGVQLYLSATTAGAYTSTKQYAPNHLVYIGVVTRQHVNQGRIEVRIQNGYEMDELHDVAAQTPSNNDGLFYNSTNSLWENKSIATALGYTPANAATTLTINGVTFDLSTSRTFTVGSVTGSGASGQVAYWTGTSAQSGSNNLFWDATNNRLGIATNTPISRLDVAGDARITQSLLVQGRNTASFTGSGLELFYTGGVSFVQSFDRAGNAVLPLSFLGSTITFRTGNPTVDAMRIFASTNNVLIQNGGTFTDGGQRLQVQGTTLLNGNVSVSGSTTASSAIARGLNLTSTLVASANSDVLVGLDIQPTFTNGAFSGVRNIPLRVGGSIVTSSGGFGGPSSRVTTLISDTSSGVYTQLAIQGPTNGGAAIEMYDGTGVAVADFGMNTLGKDFALINRMTSGIMQFYTHNGTSLGTRLYISATGNVLIGSTTDTGERLQVTGTMKVTGDSVFSGGNVAVRTTIPSTAHTSTAFMFVGRAASVTGGISVNDIAFNNNAFYDGTNSVYRNNGFATSLFLDNSGDVRLFTAASGTAGGTVAFLEMFRLFNNGSLMLQNGGTFTNVASSRLTINSTTQGFLPPRMTTTQKNAISSPAAGLVVYDTTLAKLCVYTTAWETITSI